MHIETMLVEAIVDLLSKVILSLSWVGVFILMTLESAAIPIPSEIVVPMAGFTFCNRIEEVAIGTIIVSISNTVGSLLAYWIGKRYGKDFVKKYGKYILLSSSKYERVEKLFLKYGSIIILTGRMMPAIRTFISLPAGLFKMNIHKFTLLTFLGSLPWNLIFLYLGYILRENWKIILLYSKYLDVIVLIVVLVFIYLIYRS